MLAMTLDILEDEMVAKRQRSAEPRMTVGASTTLRDAEHVPFDVLVEDFSSLGFRFTSERSFAVGTRVRVGLRGAGSEEALIVWSKGRVHGCAFDQQISRDRVATAFRASQVVAGRIASEGPAPVQEADPDRWPRPVRLTLFLGGAVLSWAGVFALVRLALH